MWNEILDESIDIDHIFDIDTPKHGDYFFARSFVHDFTGKVVYIVIVGANTDEAHETKDDIDEKFSEDFWIVLG